MSRPSIFSVICFASRPPSAEEEAPVPEVALDRDALYYPHIHIPDPNWLKATLLCFPRVVRIVPEWYPLQDEPEVQEFTRLRGPHGNLLSPANFRATIVEASQRKLLTDIKAHEDIILRNYSESSTRRWLGPQADSFQIHSQKFLGEAAEYLRSKHLAWYPRNRTSDAYLWL